MFLKQLFQKIIKILTGAWEMFGGFWARLKQKRFHTAPAEQTSYAHQQGAQQVAPQSTTSAGVNGWELFGQDVAKTIQKGKVEQLAYAIRSNENLRSKLVEAHQGGVDVVEVLKRYVESTKLISFHEFITNKKVVKILTQFKNMKIGNYYIFDTIIKNYHRKLEGEAIPPALEFPEVPTHTLQ